MSKRSFEAINYMLRPNKNVERKLVASTLNRLKTKFDIADYRYVGFGSMWFADFVLMHKVVEISDMVTIEAAVSRTKRVEFNKPFACIKVRMETAATALGEVVEKSKRSIVWLDYDGPLKNALTGDLETAVAAMSSGSLVLVSTNATVEQLKDHDRDEVRLSPAEYLAQICDTSVSNIDQNRLTRNEFPEVAAEILHSRLKGAALSRNPGCEYRPIWTFEYADDAAMVTVGGMIANDVDFAKLQECQLNQIPFISPQLPFNISLPMITDKEKRALDKLLPSQVAIDPNSLEFELRAKEIEAYCTFYREYPVFNELAA